MENLPTPPELSAELMARFVEMQARNIAFYEANATEAQKALALAQIEQFKSDPAFAAEEMDRMAQLFSESDADGNGRLNQAEFRAFYDKIIANAAAKGHFHAEHDGQVDTMYALYNEAAGGEEGFTYQDWSSFGALKMKLWMDA